MGMGYKVEVLGWGGGGEVRMWRRWRGDDVEEVEGWDAAGGGGVEMWKGWRGGYVGGGGGIGMWEEVEKLEWGGCGRMRMWRMWRGGDVGESGGDGMEGGGGGDGGCEGVTETGVSGVIMRREETKNRATANKDLRDHGRA